MTAGTRGLGTAAERAWRRATARFVLLLCMAPALAAAAPALMAAERPDALTRVDLPALDRAKFLAHDSAAAVSQPRRYAVGTPIDRSIGDGKATLGSWSTLADGSLLWRLPVEAPGALALEFAFDRYRLPAGAELRIVGTGKGNTVGPFTDAENRPHGEFHSPRVPGEHAELQLRVPAAKRELVQLQLGSIYRAYRDFLAPQALAKSGSCNVDVICPEGAAWQDQVNSVVVLSFSETGEAFRNFCSGQFVNTTGGTDPAMLLTANHCGLHPDNDETVVVYFKFENSICRMPGSPESGNVGDGPLTVLLGGATMVAQSDEAAARQDPTGIVESDFALLAFPGPPPTASGVFFTGWDRRDVAPANGTGIHHPAGDEKRISFENDPLTISGYLSPPGSGTTHLRVADWDLGTTERGSSGSGVWNPAHKLVGWLSGGFAACGNNQADWYGRLAAGWDEGPTANQRLRDWLDPAATGALELQGSAGCDRPVVQLASPAFDTVPLAGAPFTLTANVTGGAGGPRSYAWDIDADGIVDREGSEAQLQLSFPARTSTQVTVTVTDSAGCTNVATRALDVRGPEFSLTPQSPQQLCGDDDASIEPGERWRLPVALRNSGDGQFVSAGRSLFVPGMVSTEPLPLTDAGINGSLGAHDDGRASETIELGGGGFRLANVTYGSAVVSTNGYIGLDPLDTGGDWSNGCGDVPNNGSLGPRLHPLHSDLVIGETAGAGLRHEWFAECPRAPESSASTGGCDVFQWSGMQIYTDDGLSGDFDFQAILYAGSGEIAYQYRQADPLAGAESTVGLIGEDPASLLFDVSCNASGLVHDATAICLFPGAAAPVGTLPFEAEAGGYVATTSTDTPGNCAYQFIDLAAQGADVAVVIETPTPALPILPGGATAAVNVDVFVPTDAACGTPLVLDFRGAANATQSAPAAMPLAFGTIGGTQGSCSIGQCTAQVPSVDARQGLFFNAARAGNGLLNFRYGNVYGGVWYTAFADRTPAWYTLQGDYADNLAVTTLRSFTNVAAPGGFQPVPDTEGMAWVAQPSADEVLFAWQLDDGRAGIELLGSIGLPFAQPNRTQMWFAPSQSGWGNAVESNAIPGGGYSEFWATFLFDAAGVGRWVSGASGEREGAVPLQAYRVHCPGCPFLLDQLQLAQPAGSLSRTYSGVDNALLDTDIVLPAPLSGRWERDNLPIVPLGPVDPQ